MKSRLIILAVLAVLIIVVLANTILIIDAGEMAVIFNQVSGGLSARYPGPIS